MTLGQLAEPVTIYPQILINICVKDQAKTDPKVKQAVDQAANRLRGNGRILVHESETGPLLRVMVGRGKGGLRGGCGICGAHND